MALQFTRNAKVYVELGSEVWQIPVLDGFSFTQAVNSSEVTVNEAGDTSRRARLLFNDNLAPVEWSFSTYVRPFRTAGDGSGGNWDGDANDVHAVEEVLWAMLMGADTFTSSTAVWTGNSTTINTQSVLSPTDYQNSFSFAASNQSKFSDDFNLYFSFEETGNTQVYRITQAVVNSATIDFDIDGIATIQWSGFGKQVVDRTTNIPTRTIYEDITETANFIRNRISTVALSWTQSSHSPNPDAYELVLTGGSISVENNISYLTPEELGTVNIPLANVTGARSISGNLTCYLDNATSSSKSGELFADLIADTTTVRNIFDMAINVGGETVSTPRIVFDIPTAHLEVPVIGVEDLLTLDVAFHGQPSSGDVDNTDEMTVVYRA